MKIDNLVELLEETKPTECYASASMMIDGVLSEFDMSIKNSIIIECRADQHDVPAGCHSESEEFCSADRDSLTILVNINYTHGDIWIIVSDFCTAEQKYFRISGL